MNIKNTLKAHGLRARELSETADPYAKIRLLPDRSNVWQTRIHRRTLDPGKNDVLNLFLMLHVLHSIHDICNNNNVFHLSIIKTHYDHELTSKIME